MPATALGGNNSQSRHRDNDRDQVSADRATVAVFCTIVAMVTAALYLAIRSGFENPVRPVVATLGFSLFITVVPFVAWQLTSRRHYVEATPWWRCQPLLILAALAIASLAGFIQAMTGLTLWLPLVSVGYAAAAYVLVSWFLRESLRAKLAFLVGCAGFAVWVGAVVWKTDKTPVYWETLAATGDVRPEPLYDATVANMIRSYGVPSSGLGGIRYAPRDSGSAWLDALLAGLAGTDSMAFYSLASAVIAIPFCLGAMLLLALEVRRGRGRPDGLGSLPLETDLVAWLIFLAATVGLIPTSGLETMGVRTGDALALEPHMLAVGVFLLALATAIVYWRRKRTSLNAPDLVFLLVFAPAIVVVTGLLDAQVMALLVCGALGVALVGQFFRERWIAISAALCLTTAAVIYRLAMLTGTTDGAGPFAQIPSMVPPGWRVYLIPAQLFWSLVYIYLRVREERLSEIGTARRAALEGRITDVLFVAIVAVLGAMGGLTGIGGASGSHSADVQQWLAVSFLMAAAGRRQLARHEGRDRAGAGNGWLRRLRLSSVWIAALVLPISITIVLNMGRPPSSVLRANIALRRTLYSTAGVAAPLSIRSLADRPRLSRGLERSAPYPVVAALRKLDTTPLRLKRRTLLFIPQSYTRFWRISTDPKKCSIVPLIAPAASGLALLDGMPPVDCRAPDRYRGTGISRRVRPQLPTDGNPLALCSKAKTRGFSRVVVLDGSAAGGVAVRVFECPVRMASPSRTMR